MLPNGRSFTNCRHRIKRLPESPISLLLSGKRKKPDQM